MATDEAPVSDSWYRRPLVLPPFRDGFGGGWTFDGRRVGRTDGFDRAVVVELARREVARRMTGVTDDPTDPRLTHGSESLDGPPVPQAEVYLVLSEDERAKGFVRPVRRTYMHLVCGTETTMGVAIAETYAREPSFYGATYCVRCGVHRPVGEHGEFTWPDGSKVGT